MPRESLLNYIKIPIERQHCPEGQYASDTQPSPCLSVLQPWKGHPKRLKDRMSHLNIKARLKPHLNSVLPNFATVKNIGQDLRRSMLRKHLAAV